MATRSADALIASRAISALFFGFFGSVLLEVWDHRAGAGIMPAIIIGALGLTLLARAWLRYRRHVQVKLRRPDLDSHSGSS